MRKFKKEYVVLSIIIVLSIVFLVLKKSDQIKYSLPELSRVEVNEIFKIEISKKGELIRVVKDGENWRIGKQAFLADISKVDKMKKIIADLEITELISKADNLDRYGLTDSEKLEVRAFNQEGKVLREFEIGNVSSTNQHTYVKIKQDKNVYHARESFKQDFKQSVSDFRDKNVLKFDREEITDLSIKYDTLNLTMKKTVNKVKPDSKKKGNAEITKIVWKDLQGKEMKKETVDSILDKTSKLSCSKYLTEEEHLSLIKEANILFTLDLKGASDYQLKFYRKKDEKSSEYPVVSSQNKYPFYLSEYSADSIMKKDKDFILEKKKEQKK
jgi:hypothetical protein